MRVIIQLVWYILKTFLFTSVLVKVIDIYLATLWLDKYPPLSLVNKCYMIVNSENVQQLDKTMYRAQYNYYFGEHLRHTG